jgi:hypothetical protein
MKRVTDFLGQVLSYILLMIDRLILVPFVFISSYSPQDLVKKADRYTTFAMLRSLGAILVTIIVLLLKWIF